eukprot:CAMPEP_0181369064 /NCGR_PEP_ID=MMETSP1106-20121128/12531_1 /TAXON_ID=81844 /ORGANISM="Mantoniella antarctica, Strain SL-175" /LENGTH=169 /DNA_ID=CAMNT_0023485441 /DNA_START=376 /DNA_END=885 /DNA_ORIENTATION=+
MRAYAALPPSPSSAIVCKSAICVSNSVPLFCRRGAGCAQVTSPLCEPCAFSNHDGGGAPDDGPPTVAFPSHATIFNLSTCAMSLNPPGPVVLNVTSSNRKVHTLSQKRYVSRLPLNVVLVFTSFNASFMHLSNCARTFIASDGVSSPLVTISSRASVSVMPRVERRYSS